MNDKDYYKILQIDSAAEQEVVQAAYRRLVQKYHPDVNKSADANKRMQELNEAYEVLGDISKRAAYDRSRTSPSSRSGTKPRTSSRPRQTANRKSSSEAYTPQQSAVEAQRAYEAQILYRCAQLEEEIRRLALALNDVEVDIGKTRIKQVLVIISGIACVGFIVYGCTLSNQPNSMVNYGILPLIIGGGGALLTGSYALKQEESRKAQYQFACIRKARLQREISEAKNELSRLKSLGS